MSYPIFLQNEKYERTEDDEEWEEEEKRTKK